MVRAPGVFGTQRRAVIVSYIDDVVAAVKKVDAKGRSPAHISAAIDKLVPEEIGAEEREQIYEDALHELFKDSLERVAARGSDPQILMFPTTSRFSTILSATQAGRPMLVGHRLPRERTGGQDRATKRFE